MTVLRYATRSLRKPRPLSGSYNCATWVLIKPLSRRNFSNSPANEPNRINPPYNVLFFGSDRISLKTLQVLHQNAQKTGADRVVKHLEVMCPREKVPSPKFIVPVKKYAMEHSLTVHHPLPSLKEWTVPKTPSNEDFHIAVVVSFGYLIPNTILDAFPMGGINMHPSLLPKYRGAAPIYHTLLNDEKETGISIVELSRNKFDTGKIFQQTRLDIPPTVTFLQLVDVLAEQGAQKVLETLQNYWYFKERAWVQSEEGASKAPKPSKEWRYVDFTKQTAQQVYVLWRALGETMGLYTLYNFNQERVRLITLRPPTVRMSYKNVDKYEQDETYEPGMFRYDKFQRLLFIKCASGWIPCETLQVENRPVVTAEQFVVGYRVANLKTADKQHKFIKLQQ